MIILAVGDLIYLLIIVILIILFFVSLGLFIKRRIISQNIKEQSLRGIEEKLDRVIELLEDKSN